MASFPSFGIIGLVLTCITTLINLVGLSIPLWTKSGTVNYGLWKYCISGTCFDTVALKGWFKAFAFFSLGGAVVLGILRMIVFKDKKMIPAIAMAACFTAGGLIFLAVAKYGAEDFHFGYVLELLSIYFSIGCGFLYFLTMRETLL